MRSIRKRKMIYRDLECGFGLGLGFIIRMSVRFQPNRAYDDEEEVWGIGDQDRGCWSLGCCGLVAWRSRLRIARSGKGKGEGEKGYDVFRA